MNIVRKTLKISGLIARLIPGVTAGAFLLAAFVGGLKLFKDKKEQR
jgi:hypothetical protein